MGCLCAFREDWQAAARRLKPWRLWLIVVSLFLLVLVPQDDLAPLVRRPFRIGFDTMANGLIAAWLLGSVGASIGLMHRILNSRPMVALGTVSYSLYLWQQLFIRLAPLSGTSMPLAVAGALGAATISYWLLERPLTTLRRKLRAPGTAASWARPLRGHEPHGMTNDSGLRGGIAVWSDPRSSVGSRPTTFASGPATRNGSISRTRPNQLLVPGQSPGYVFWWRGLLAASWPTQRGRPSSSTTT
jgi:hypothetical protein